MANEIPLGVTRNHLQVTSLQATLKERDDEITRLTNQVSFPNHFKPPSVGTLPTALRFVGRLNGYRDAGQST